VTAGRFPPILTDWIPPKRCWFVVVDRIGTLPLNTLVSSSYPLFSLILLLWGPMRVTTDGRLFVTRFTEVFACEGVEGVPFYDFPIPLFNFPLFFRIILRRHCVSSRQREFTPLICLWRLVLLWCPLVILDLQEFSSIAGMEFSIPKNFLGPVLFPSFFFHSSPLFHCRNSQLSNVRETFPHSMRARIFIIFFKRAGTLPFPQVPLFNLVFSNQIRSSPAPHLKMNQTP